MKRMVFGCLLFALMSTVVWAQSTAQINGTVTDASGAVLPGVEVTATQTGTGLTRSVVTNETGSYAMPNLPVGPYRLEASLPGFRSFAQTGIILTVGSNPVINIVLEVGQLSETIEVQADAALVETRTTGIGQIIDNVRITELPLNARQVTELIIGAGAAVGGGTQNTPRNYPTDIISVAGGTNNGLSFYLDGGVHNDPYGNQTLPLPFPDAIQEFKVETSAVPAQYGFHAAGAVNVVTKSGTNEFHGSLFEFVRNRVFNARNTFAREKDGLKRNQFGGVVGGPIVENKLFFFGGLQTTLTRSDPRGIQGFIPTAQMLAGDWTTYASAACQAGGAIRLGAPFVDNRIDPALFSKPAVDLLKRFTVSSNDPCGRISFGRKSNLDEWFPIGRIDYQANEKHSLFGRFEMGRRDEPSDYDGQTILSISLPDYYRHAKSFVLGDTYSISPNMVSSFRGTVLRTVNDKTMPDYFNFGDLGVKGVYHPPGYAKIALVTVTGAFTLIGGQPTPSITNSTVYHLSEDLSWIRGAHQIGFGGMHVHNMMNYTASTSAPGSFNFSGRRAGVPLADFMVGLGNTFTQSRITSQYYRQNFVSLYLQDTWKANSHLTLNAGVRWEPFIGPYDAASKGALFSRERFDQGIRSEIFPNAPAGIYFQGEGGIPDTQKFRPDSWNRFAPRVGLAWDPKGDGLMTVRAAYGIFFDAPHLHQYGGRRDTPPKGASIQVQSPSFEDPWASYPGGVSPHPIAFDRNVAFPANGVYTVFPWDLKSPYINQWNLSVQKQFGANWLVTANYLGSNVIHMLYRYEANPAVYVPGVGDANRNCFLDGVRLPYTVAPGAACSTVGNTNQRRVLFLANSAIGQSYANIAYGDAGATHTYNGLVLQVQRRRANGITIQGNYTWSHAIDDGYNDVIQNNGGQTQERRRANRSNSELDRRHNFNMSIVYELPRFSDPTVRKLFTGWQMSGITRILSGPFLTITNGTERSLTGTVDQAPIQVLPSAHPEKKTIDRWFNPAAFIQPPLGSYGNVPAKTVGGPFLGPGSIGINMGLTRKFQLRENQTLEFRAEAFNVPNHVNPGTPELTLNSATFGQILSAGDPRIMQMALKYVF